MRRTWDLRVHPGRERAVGKPACVSKEEDAGLLRGQRRTGCVCLRPSGSVVPGEREEGEREGGGLLKIDSDSPERGHGAIPGTFPLHPVTLLAKQS